MGVDSRSQRIKFSWHFPFVLNHKIYKVYKLFICRDIKIRVHFAYIHQYISENLVSKVVLENQHRKGLVTPLHAFPYNSLRFRVHVHPSLSLQQAKIMLACCLKPTIFPLAGLLCSFSMFTYTILLFLCLVKTTSQREGKCRCVS